MHEVKPSTASQEPSRHDPHQLLGLHGLDPEHQVIRILRPGAQEVHLEVDSKIVQAQCVDSRGLFEYRVSKFVTFLDYRLYYHNGVLAHDPYAFTPTFGEMDAYLLAKGVHYRLYEVMGARLCTHQGVKGIKCAVWAPNAKSVAIVGDFNQWDGRTHPMRVIGSSGVWELFLPGLGSGEKYKFEILTQQETILLKADPFALSAELRPSTASVSANVDSYEWKDEVWMQQRAQRHGDGFPLNIYEVHLDSWKQQGMNYRSLAPELSAYCKEMGFSHVELMAIMEHPLDESWGYQVTGFFATNARHGTPSDFQYFVDYLHREGIGVLMDWVPAHFPTDGHALARFDGSYLFEHADPRKGFHPHWNTYIFNYGRHEVVNFLIASALFWINKMHIDGLRVDAVASMLYLDYGRKEGEWIPNIHGGKENLEAIEFIKHLNAIVHQEHATVLMCAEESTSFTGVSHPLEWGGLGFDLKWNMGWMNDTLRYMKRDPLFRSHYQNDVTFGLLYAFSERFILPLSHDEVVHGKASLISKMPGDDWQKFAQMRLLYSYMICHPGKKLIFMGAEIGQWSEWNCKSLLSWELLKHERHRMLQQFFKEMNHFYHQHQALWEMDSDGKGFEWVDLSDHHNCTISYLRKGTNHYLCCVHNFTPNSVPDYFIRLSNVRAIRQVFNTDREEYGGSGKLSESIRIVQDNKQRRTGFHIELAPLATMIFEVEFVY